jgi:hypothetical protein
MKSNIVELKPFIAEISKAACDTWKQPEDTKVNAIPIGHLLQIAVKYTIKTAEGWSEKNKRSYNILSQVQQLLEDLPEANE